MSQTRTVETIGSDIDQAIEAGLKLLDVSRENVYVEVLEEPSRGLLGIGARQARVRLTTTMPPRSDPAPQSLSTKLDLEDKLEAPPAPKVEVKEVKEIKEVAKPVIKEVQEKKPEPPIAPPITHASTAPSLARSPRPSRPEPAPNVVEDNMRSVIEGVEAEKLNEEVKVGVEVLRELLSSMGVEAELTIERAFEEDIPDNPWILHVHGENLGFLIGRKGETLAALQYLARVIASRGLEERASFVIDVENYKARREVLLSKLAQRMAKEALRRRRRVELEPMPPHERRIIHMTLRDHPQVRTESIGEGNRRRVTIVPKR